MSIMNNKVNVFRSKSIQDNNLKHNYKYIHNEDLAAIMPALIKQTVEVDDSFVRIHRKKKDNNKLSTFLKNP